MANETLSIGRRSWLQTLLVLGAPLLSPAGIAHGAPGPSGAAAHGAGQALPLHLSLNENPFGPSPRALEAIRSHLTGLSRYTGSEADALLAVLAAREGVSAEQIVLGDVLEALGQLLARQGGPGGEILYANPGYTALVDAGAAYGSVGVPVPLDAKLEHDLPGFRARLGPRTRAVFLVNPHNPSGTLCDARALHDFVAEAARTTTVVVDEAYLEFAPDFAARSLVRQVSPSGRVVVFRTFTKFFGLAALPLGYAVLPSELAATLRQQGLGAARAQNRLALVAAQASLGDTAFATHTRERVGRERERWFGVLDALRLPRSQAAGNFVFFRSGRPHAQLAAALLERGIDIGRAFPPLTDWARISIGLPEENARAQQALRQVLGS